MNSMQDSISATPCMSVIVPAHNASRFIGAALDSLFAQTRTDFEVIVVDDGSSDGTADVVTSIATQRSTVAAGVRVIRQNRTGAGGARNRGATEARSALIGFLDADDRWDPRKVERQVDRFDTAPEIDLCCTGFRHMDFEGHTLAGTIYIPPANLNHASLLALNTIHTSTVVIRREVFQRLGGFDPSLETHEDHDLWLRVTSLRKGNIGVITECLCDYRRWQGQMSHDWRRMEAGWKRIMDRQAIANPSAWARAAPVARANHLDYCASLAYASGDIKSLRRLILESWMARAQCPFQRPHSGFFTTALAIATLLPAPIQSTAFKALERCRGRWRRAISINVTAAERLRVSDQPSRSAEDLLNDPHADSSRGNARRAQDGARQNQDA